LIIFIEVGNIFNLPRVGAMFVDVKVGSSALLTFLVWWHSCAVSLPPGACTIKLFTPIIYGFFVISKSVCPWQAFPA
jgi:hypothetical protein